MYKRNIEARSCNHYGSGKAISTTYCVSVCSLTYPACNAHAPYCHVACPDLQYFSTLFHKQHDFQKKVTEYKMCVLISSTTFV